MVEDGNLLLKPLESGEESSRCVLLEQAENMKFRSQPLWTMDSSRFAIWRTKDVEERRIDYIDSSLDDRLQPRHFSKAYPKPGDEIDTRRPWIFFTAGREAIEPDASLTKAPYETNQLRWREDAKRFSYEYIERGFGKYHVIEVNSKTREQRPLVR